MSSEWATNHDGEILTVQQMKDIYNLPSKEHEDYEAKVAALTWYVDEYLPGAAPSYSKEFRQDNLMTQGVDVWGQSTTAVTLQSEAFAHLLYDNCYDKWKIIARERHNNTKFKVPKYSKNDERTWKYHLTKYSDRNAGKGNGWNNNTTKAHNDCLKRIKEFRDNDRMNKYKTIRLVRDLIRAKYNLQDYNSSKKRKRDDVVTQERQPLTIHEEIIVLSDTPDIATEEEWTDNDDED
jgi:hypothetical protein